MVPRAAEASQRHVEDRTVCPGGETGRFVLEARPPQRRVQWTGQLLAAFWPTEHRSRWNRMKVRFQGDGSTVAASDGMSVAIRQQTTDQLPTPDNWLDALTKLIPGEVIAAFTGALQVGGVAGSLTAQLVVLLVLTPLAPLVLLYSAHRSGSEVHPLQYAVRTAAFVLYALASSPDVMRWLAGNDVRWIPGVGAFVVALLASFIIAPRS
jgi:hypothetical protein